MRRYRIFILATVAQIAFWGFANYSLYRARQINRETSLWVRDLGKKAAETERLAKEAESVCKASDESRVPTPETKIEPCRQGQSLGPGESCGLAIPFAIAPRVLPPGKGTGLPKS